MNTPRGWVGRRWAAAKPTSPSTRTKNLGCMISHHHTEIPHPSPVRCVTPRGRYSGFSLVIFSPLIFTYRRVVRSPSRPGGRAVIGRSMSSTKASVGVFPKSSRFAGGGPPPGETVVQNMIKTLQRAPSTEVFSMSYYSREIEK